MGLTRRAFVAKAAVTGASVATSRAAALGRSGGYISVNGVHEQVAECARPLIQKHVPLRVLYPKGCLANLNPVVQAFQQATGGHVLLKEAPTDDITTEMILSTHVPTRAFDVALPPTFNLPDLVDAKAIIPLDDFRQKYEPDNFQDHVLMNLGDFYQGRFYGYQADGDVYLMFFNRLWLEDSQETKRYEDRYGRSLDVPKTWEELDIQLRFFNCPKEGRYGGSLFRNLNYIGWEFWARLHGLGRLPVDDDMRPQFHQEEGIAALSAMLEASAYLEPRVQQLGLFGNFRSFSEGNKYCNIGWGGTQKYLQRADSKLKDKLIHAPLPGGVFGGEPRYIPIFNWGWNYTVSVGSVQSELGYLFCLYASTPEISKISVREQGGYFDPFRSEHYEDPDIKAIYGDSFLSAHKRSMSSCIPDFYMRGQGQYLDVLKQSLKAAMSGYLSPKEAMTLVTQKWEAITEKLGRDAQVNQWRCLKNSYPANILEHLR